jgi:HlyD family secretion protein
VWIFIVLIIIIAGGGYAYYQYALVPEELSDAPSIQTATVRQGDLIIRASGSGELIALNEVDLGFGTAGTIAELYVQVGDEVTAGDTLAVQGEKEQLEAAVSSDQLAVINAEKALQDLYDNADLVTAQAMIALAQAQDALSDSEYTRFVQQEGNRASNSTIQAAEAKLVLAKIDLDNAQVEYNKYYGRPMDDPARANAQTKLSAAQQRYDSALRELNWYLGEPTENQQALLDGEVALALAKLAEAEREYERVKDGPDPDEVAKAELQLIDANAKLAVSQENLDQSVIVAPMDGILLEVNGQVGNTVSGTFITLADLNQPHLEIFLDETDLDKIEVGYAAEVIFDALPDNVFTGHVVLVDPTLIQSQGVSAVRGIVELDNAPIDSLPLGLGASVDVVAGSAEGVPLIPFEALRELGSDEYAVFVMEADEPKLRVVGVGLMDFSFVEITFGLDPGEVITTGIVETE